MRRPLHKCLPLAASYQRMTRCASFSCATSPFTFKRQVNIMSRCFLGFLDETVEQHHPFPLYTEQNPGDPPSCPAAPDFPQFAAKRSDERHADRPRKLNVL